jgi:hypothetical protein
MEYKSLDIFEIKDKGKVFVVENDKDRNRDDNDLIGSEVIIDGENYKVRGVESFAIPIIAKGQKIGLLV